jgi:uncharacterized protein YndB with AHSA1/START domain
MSDLTTESTIYVTYIRASAEKVWDALTSADFTKQFFFGQSVESDWREGSPWRLRKADGEISVTGVVREAKRPHTLVLTWNVPHPEQKFPECIVSYEIADAGEHGVRLTLTEAHPTPIPRAWLAGGREGWPKIISGLKTLLETGVPLNIPMPQQEKPR